MAALVPSPKSENHRYVSLADTDWSQLKPSSQPSSIVSGDKQKLVESDVGALLVYNGSEYSWESYDSDFESIEVSQEKRALPEKLSDDFYAQKVIEQKPEAIVINVPAQFQSEKVLRLSDLFDSKDSSFIKHFHLKLGKNAQLKVHNDLLASSTTDKKSRSFLSLVSFDVEQDAQLKVFQMQQLHKSCVFSIRQQMTAAKNARAELWTYHEGAGKGQHRVESLCEGSHSHVAVKFGIRARETQKIDIWACSHHPNTHSVSDTTSWNVVTEEAVVVFNGNIKITPTGTKTEAYQSNKNLLLSDKAQVHSLPKLEIATDDVKCSHGATIATLDANQLFYMQSRGIPKESAEKMLIDGFTRPVLAEIPLESVRKECLGKFEVVFEDA